MDPRQFLLGMSLALGAVSVAAAPAPWELHGPVQPDSQGHRLQHEDGSPFLWIGDTAWGMFQQLTREEIDAYLDRRRAQGFNVIQAVAYWYPHGGGMRSGPHNAANAYGQRPFTGTEDAPNTDQPLIAAGGSPESPNDYWDHFDYAVRAIRRRGMYLALLPCWARAYITPQFGGAHPEFDAREARAFGQFLGRRLQHEPHVLWVLGGDAKAQVHGYDHDVFTDFDKRDVIRAMAEGIAFGVTGERVSWNRQQAAWQRLFMTYHPDGDYRDNSSKWFHRDAWLTANGIEVWRDVDRVYPTVLADYLLRDPEKPTLFLEGSYEFGSYRHACGWVTPVRQRRQMYHTFFAGGAGFTYGAGPVWSMRGDSGDYNCGYTWQQALEFPGARQFATIARRFLEEQDWTRWIPDGRVLNGTVSSGDDLKVAVASAGGRKILVYFSNISHARIRNVLASAATASWFDPRDGHFVEAGSFAPGEVRLIAPPNGWEDGILILEARGAPAAGQSRFDQRPSRAFQAG